MFIIDPNPEGDIICDLCNADHTHSEEMGGILIGSYALCPECAKRSHSIPDDWARSGETFASFVWRIRAGITASQHYSRK